MASSTRKITSVFRPNLFADQVAIVTGGGTGIGRAITEELLHLGCKVMIASRKLDRLQQAAIEMKDELSGPGLDTAELEHMECNIRKEEQVKHLISNTLSRFGKINFLVNNGGGQFISSAESISLKGWTAVVETNLTGTFLCCREAYTQWMQEHGGSIVSIIADHWRGFPGFSHTCASRAGVDSLMKTLALEWAVNGVRVNSVAPGIIYSKTAAINYGSDEIFDASIEHIPAKRLGRTEEVAGAVCYLLSPAAAYITGDTLKIDGASSLWRVNWGIPDHDKFPDYSWSMDSDKRKSKL